MTDPKHLESVSDGYIHALRSAPGECPPNVGGLRRILVRCRLPCMTAHAEVRNLQGCRSVFCFCLFPSTSRSSICTPCGFSNTGVSRPRNCGNLNLQNTTDSLGEERGHSVSVLQLVNVVHVYQSLHVGTTGTAGSRGSWRAEMTALLSPTPTGRCFRRSTPAQTLQARPEG